MANVDSVDITVHGRGGHGAAPHTTIDPIVLAAQHRARPADASSAREINPLDPAVVTVGSIHGGTKHNIIPDEVKLQLTVRTLQARGAQALARGIDAHREGRGPRRARPEEPLVTVEEGPSAVYNDPELTGRLVQVIGKELGEQSVVEVDKIMGAEDFSEYRIGGMPTCMLWLGAVEPAKVQAARRVALRWRRRTRRCSRPTASER